MSDTPSASDTWPFMRRDPDCVTLDVRPGHAPSPLPPVRIFLGTEEAQYRAERIFFYSIEKVRDPARVYEIHLMKNIEGFDRSRWRTGFTNYRYAIPDFAGRKGKAIYNDVDQIYLADPALLFDLEMGDHGYLAISPKDTSVMLIDCERMAAIWNRETAASQGKHQLINKPAATPGLWGELDGHWNARDLEYVEGRTKCLHYTALHQQPWHPFPEVYSYHPNPLAYIWHDLEREADAENYQPFTAEKPSPDFARRLALAGRDEAATAATLSDGARRLIGESGAKRCLLVHAAGAGPVRPELQGLEVEELALTPEAVWPEGRYDIVSAQALFEHVPPADIPWLMDGLFARAAKLVHLAVPATAEAGLGSALWWRQRLVEAAARHPGISWHLDALEKAAPIPGRITSFQQRRAADPGAPRVWGLTDGDRDRDCQVEALGRALGWPFETRRVAPRGAAWLPRVLQPEGSAGLDPERSDRLEPPWPDLVIAAGPRSAPVAAWIRRASGGATRVVQLGSPEAPFALFDLIVTAPHNRLPVRENVLQVTAPLTSLSLPAVEAAAKRWQDRLEGLASPRLGLFVGPARPPYRMTPESARDLARTAVRRAGELGGSLVLWFEPGTPASLREAVLAEAGEAPFIASDDPAAGETGAREGLAARLDRAVMTGDDPHLLSSACLAGVPVELFELPTWQDRAGPLKPLIRLGHLATGGGVSYRGTPHQQHFVARWIDDLVTRGVIRLPRDPRRFHQALIARGLVTRIDDRRLVATPKPLDDRHRVVERVRALMCEVRPAGSTA